MTTAPRARRRRGNRARSPTGHGWRCSRRARAPARASSGCSRSARPPRAMSSPASPMRPTARCGAQCSTAAWSSSQTSSAGAILPSAPGCSAWIPTRPRRSWSTAWCTPAARWSRRLTPYWWSEVRPVPDPDSERLGPSYGRDLCRRGRSGNRSAEDHTFLQRLHRSPRRPSRERGAPVSRGVRARRSRRRSRGHRRSPLPTARDAGLRPRLLGRRKRREPGFHQPRRQGLGRPSVAPRRWRSAKELARVGGMWATPHALSGGGVLLNDGRGGTALGATSSWIDRWAPATTSCSPKTPAGRCSPTTFRVTSRPRSRWSVRPAASACWRLRRPRASTSRGCVP